MNFIYISRSLHCILLARSADTHNKPAQKKHITAACTLRLSFDGLGRIHKFRLSPHGAENGRLIFIGLEICNMWSQNQNRAGAVLITI